MVSLPTDIVFSACFRFGASPQQHLKKIAKADTIASAVATLMPRPFF